MTCMDVAADLDPYLDRELDADRTAAVRAHLTGCAACRGRLAARQELGRMLRDIDYHPAPDRLRARVAANTARRNFMRTALTLAAAAALAISIGGGVVLLRFTAAQSAPAAEDVVAAHVRSLMADHLLDVESSDQHTVKPWFLGRIDFSPPVTDLTSDGFPLAGGRLEYLEHRPVAALVYRRQQHAINVFVLPADTPASTTVVSQTLRGFHVRHWLRDATSFWVVSDLNEPELERFVRTFQGRLRSAAAGPQ